MDNTEYSYRVEQYPDGKYRWVYDVKLLRNFSILIDVYKVLGITILIVLLINWLMLACAGELSWDNMIGFSLEMILIMGGIMLVLGFLGYFFYAWMVGWRYSVLFILDEKEVVHQQMPRVAKKAEMVGKLAILVGALAKRPSVAGSGILSASRTTMTTVLANVSRLIPCRRSNLIKVNQLLSKNRVYVPDEDFDFVYDFLCQHCQKARKG